MKLSLSVRTIEATCKTKLHLPLEELVRIAADTGYDAICMRASAAGVQSSEDELRRIREVVEQAGLCISMVTADFNVPLNNEQGPDSLRDIGPSLDVAAVLGCDLIRVCMKKNEDIPLACQAADRAAERGIRLVHQCHTASLFEEIQPMLDLLAKIDRPNFGLIYEPANLMLCGQPYDAETLLRLQPHLMNIYVQNHVLDRQGPVTLDTYCLGQRRFHHLALWEKGGVKFDKVFEGLQTIGYNGYFTIHQAQGIENLNDARAFAAQCTEFIRGSCGSWHSSEIR